MIRMVFIALLAIAWTPVSSGAVQQVNLQQAQRLALERNLNLKAADLDARASEALVRKGYGIYDPLAEADLSTGESRDWTTSSSVPYKSVIKSRAFDFSLSQLFPSGGELTVGLDNSRSQVAEGYAPSVNPSWRSQAYLSLVQPLLQSYNFV